MAMEVEHVKAHRTNKEKQCMSRLEKFVTEGNEKADELAKEGAMLDEGSGRNEKRCTQLCSVQPAFTVWWSNGKIVKNSRRSRKKGFRGSEKRDEASNGRVRGNQQVSVHEVWKKQQILEDVRKMHRTFFLSIFSLEMVKASNGRS